MNTIQEKWDEYEKKVIPKEAGAHQRIECKRAFYGGACSAMAILEGLPADISEDAGAAILQGLNEEIADYVKVQKNIGATGGYPDGKSREDDEGELGLAIRTNKKKGLIGIEFGKPVAWMQFSAGDARNLAAVLLIQADLLEEKDGTRTRKV